MRPANPSDRVVVVGGGIAGLATALHLAPLPVTLLVAAALGQQASTPLAQGGIAAALGADDHPALHAADTLQAGAGLSDPDVAARVAAAAPSCIEWLVAQGAAFDRTTSGDDLILGLEAAHSRRRIAHAHGDRTGKRVLDALIHAVRNAPSVQIMEHHRVTELALDVNGAVAGVFCFPWRTEGGDEPILIPGRAVVLATGGLGGLYAHTTNPLSAHGGGLALAARAGVVLRDLEFVQFHPTAIAVGLDPMPLATEALRGEGARLVNSHGEHFMQSIPGAELAPRDVVARAIFAQIQSGERVFLDTRHVLGEQVTTKFPGVTALCRAAGLDPVRDPIPVRPAAHYHMGGIQVDDQGRCSVEGLWAGGEVASTGLHGANRLASNSLLEALAYAAWVAEDIRAMESRAATGQLPSSSLAVSHRPGSYQRSACLQQIRSVMDLQVGVLRDEAGLQAAIGHLRALMRNANAADIHDAAMVSLMIAVSAVSRNESRGAHQRLDHRGLVPEQHTEMTLDQALRLAAEIDNETAALARRVA
ncbi:L-aspartate oxidase (plasmid) [Microvirga ossetica]|uniref:L-aspartate oxidase n=1 Tax=Microvirga ossetica TaxID=1882682 RepID=A0A1B2EYN2_9HYPH|nr:L-aspartate oxidase [Microvirga ossetica]ANY85095.1 L-aspartate oxidase [Microvirga ossetica]